MDTAEIANRSAVLAAARHAAAVLSLSRDPVAVPSRGGIDDYAPIWLC